MFALLLHVAHRAHICLHMSLTSYIMFVRSSSVYPLPRVEQDFVIFGSRISNLPSIHCRNVQIPLIQRIATQCVCAILFNHGCQLQTTHLPMPTFFFFKVVLPICDYSYLRKRIPPLRSSQFTEVVTQQKPFLRGTLNFIFPLSCKHTFTQVVGRPDTSFLPPKMAAFDRISPTSRTL